MSEQNGQSNADITANEDFDNGLRLGIASALGQTGFNSIDDENPRRNLYDTFGWPKDDLDGWDEDNWLALYLRNGYAQTINDKPAEVSWRDTPIVEDEPEGEEQTSFEAAIERAEKNLNLWAYCTRTDKVAGIGQHGLLLLGLSDIATAEDRTQWEEDATEQSYTNGLDDIDNLKPVLESQIDDIDWGGPEDGNRWGKPVRYTIDFSDDIDDETEDDQGYRTVHWTRVVDVPAQAPLDDETLSRPRAEPCLNNLIDIEKTLGATAEAAFMSANSDIHLNSDPTQVDMEQGADQIRDELMRYFEGQPFLRTQGMDVNQLGGEVQDPSGIIENNLDVISSVTGIPKSTLRGNQSGEVSGAEKDERDLFGMAEERRTQYNTPFIVRKVIDRLVDLGILPQPNNGTYEVEWPKLDQLTAKDQSEIETNRATVLRQAGPIVPGLSGSGAQEYLKTGDIPDEVENTPQPAETADMQAQFDDQFNLESNAEVDTTPPNQAQTNAEAVLEIRDKTDAMTDTGWNRAKQLASGESLSTTVIQKMAQFKRHQSNTEYKNFSDVPESKKSEDAENPWWEDNGTVAWFGWGGTAGVEWAVEQSEELSSNATQYEEGDTVDTPEGVGVVMGVLTETVESEGEKIEASESSPTYLVLTETERDEMGKFKASEISSTEIDVDVEEPEADLASNAKQSRLDHLAALLTGNQEGRFQWPESWRKSNTPARVIALKAFAGMGGSFDGCVREMRGSVTRPEAFCGDFIDRLVGNPYWRGQTPLPGS